ncbi:MAG: hypothetical protein V1771_04515 [Chloroflexota bacterium]
MHGNGQLKSSTKLNKQLRNSRLRPKRKQIERQLKVLGREQHQLLQWALKDFPADQVEAENKRLNRARETLKARSAELETQLKVSQDAVINIPKLEGFIERVQGRLPQLDFEGKRLALDMLGITVWLDGENVEVTGTIDPETDLQVVRCTRNLEKLFPLSCPGEGDSRG